MAQRGIYFRLYQMQFGAPQMGSGDG
jgi:hypothetical protein